MTVRDGAAPSAFEPGGDVETPLGAGELDASFRGFAVGEPQLAAASATTRHARRFMVADASGSAGSARAPAPSLRRAHDRSAFFSTATVPRARAGGTRARVSLDTPIDETYAAETFAAMTDDELVRAVTRDRDDYVERALELARAELERRGVTPVAVDEKAAALPKRSARRSRAVGERWLDVYATLLVVAAVGLPVAAVVAGGTLASLFPWALPLAGLQLVVASGLRTRKRWAWNLHWLLLLLRAFADGRAIIAMGPVAIALAAAALLATSIYFARRRALFT
jgi:hypothetical protein